MTLSEETKSKICRIIDEDLKDFYGKLNDDPEKRERLGQFYTPGKVCCQMIEKFDCDSLEGLNILDPTVGSGNLLIACLAAGADSDKVFGNEYDQDAVDLCRERLDMACDILGKPHIRKWQIHRGNALIKDCLTEFRPDYDETILKDLLKNRITGRWIDDPEAYETGQTDLFADFLN